MQSRNCDPRPKPATAETPKQQLASVLLNRPVADFISDRRAAGRSYRHITRDLYDATNGKIDVTNETIRSWHGQAEAVSS